MWVIYYFGRKRVEKCWWESALHYIKSLYAEI